MKFRLEWIASYLPGWTANERELRQKLTAAGLIVEGVEGSGAEAVLDIEITANRPDCMNHRGVAREAAVALGRSFVLPAPSIVAGELDEAVETLAHVVIEEPALCSRYSSRVLTGVRIGESAGVLRERLQALGLSTISGPVDATNFVLWDMGQPMHAFDLDRLARGPDGRVWIVVRCARPGETLVTLDGVVRTLSPEHLVIADSEGPVALAGVMGGLATAITSSTRNILLESAHFDPTVVRRGSRSLGMHTDASHRFERGTDAAATVEALDEVCCRVLADGGKAAAGRLDVVARAVSRPTIRLRLAQVNRFLGMDIPEERTRQVLQDLGFACAQAEAGALDVKVPSWRVDVEREVDLIEEVIRHVGYASLPETLPPAYLPTQSDPRVELEDRVRDVLSGAGLFEACTYSFVSAEENAPFESAAPGGRLAIGNPLGEPYEILRATPLIGLLQVARHNTRRGVADVAVFEVGRAYGREVEGGRAVESRRACLLLAGRACAHWSTADRDVDLYDASGLVATLFSGLGLREPEIEPWALPFLSAGRSARILTDRGMAGWLGVLKGSLASAWDLEDPIVVDVDLGRLPSFVPPSSVEAPSRFPGSDVDVTVTHRVSLPFQALRLAVRNGAPAELVSVDVKYRYQGGGVPDGFVKTTLHLAFGSCDRSLSREEVNAWRDQAAARILGLAETRVDGVSQS